MCPEDQFYIICIEYPVLSCAKFTKFLGTLGNYTN